MGMSGQSYREPPGIKQFQGMWPLLSLLKVHISGQENRIFQSCLICTHLTKKDLGIFLAVPTKTLSAGERQFYRRTELLIVEDKWLVGQPDHKIAQRCSVGVCAFWEVASASTISPK